ncbi:MAG: flagellar protein FlaG [Alicyclobacillus sp.]|nr:flagellar protein FlaG [Alicyclobacillus sp.]
MDGFEDYGGHGVTGVGSASGTGSLVDKVLNAGATGKVRTAGTTGSASEAKQAGATQMAEEGTLSDTALQKSVDRLNQLLAGGPTRVEIDTSAPTNDVWLNVVDKATGTVIERFPPEGLRHFVETANPRGLTRDWSV